MQGAKCNALLIAELFVNVFSCFGLPCCCNLAGQETRQSTGGARPHLHSLVLNNHFVRHVTVTICKVGLLTWTRTIEIKNRAADRLQRRGRASPTIDEGVPLGAACERDRPGLANATL